MDKAMEKMLKENEINYIIEMLKKKDDNKCNEVIKLSAQKGYFEQAKKTLEILMTKMGLSEVYNKMLH